MSEYFSLLLGAGVSVSAFIWMIERIKQLEKHLPKRTTTFIKTTTEQNTIDIPVSIDSAATTSQTVKFTRPVSTQTRQGYTSASTL